MFNSIFTHIQWYFYSYSMVFKYKFDGISPHIRWYLCAYSMLCLHIFTGTSTTLVQLLTLQRITSPLPWHENRNSFKFYLTASHMQQHQGIRLKYVIIVMPCSSDETQILYVSNFHPNHQTCMMDRENFSQGAVMMGLEQKMGAYENCFYFIISHRIVWEE